MHFQDATDDPLFPLVIHYDAANASLAEGKVMCPVGRLSSLSNGDVEPDESAPNRCFGGRELGCNLSQRPLFHDVFLMEDGLIKSYWKCINY